MTMPLLPLSYSTFSSPLSTFPKILGTAWTNSVQLIEKTKRVAYPHIAACSGLYYCGYGTSEFSQAALPMVYPNAHSNDKVNKDFLIIHGGLVAATGVCGVLECLNGFGVITYGKSAHVVCAAGSIFFLYANLVELGENIRLYRETEKKSFVDDPALEKQIFVQRSALIWGMLSNIGYIAASVFLLLNAEAAMAFVFGVIGTFSSAFQLICNYFIEKRV